MSFAHSTNLPKCIELVGCPNGLLGQVGSHCAGLVHVWISLVSIQNPCRHFILVPQWPIKGLLPPSFTLFGTLFVPKVHWILCYSPK